MRKWLWYAAPLLLWALHYGAMQYAVARIVGPVTLETPSTLAHWTRFGLTAGTHILLVVVALVGLLLERGDRREVEGAPYRTQWSTTAVAWAPISVLLLGATQLVVGGAIVAATRHGLPVWPDPPNPGWLPFHAILLLVTAPLCEELFFRVYLFTALKRRHGVWWAHALSAIAFWLGHAAGNEGVLGFAVGQNLLFELTGRYQAVVLVHVLTNLRVVPAGIWIRAAYAASMALLFAWVAGSGLYDGIWLALKQRYGVARRRKPAGAEM